VASHSGVLFWEDSIASPARPPGQVWDAGTWPLLDRRSAFCQSPASLLQAKAEAGNKSLPVGLASLGHAQARRCGPVKRHAGLAALHAHAVGRVSPWPVDPVDAVASPAGPLGPANVGHESLEDLELPANPHGGCGPARFQAEPSLDPIDSNLCAAQELWELWQL